MSEKYKENISAVDAIKEDALMNEYLMTRFKCYTDYLEESAMMLNVLIIHSNIFCVAEIVIKKIWSRQCLHCRE